VVMSLGSNRILLMASLCEILVKAITGLLFIWAWGLTGLAWSAVLSYWVEKGILAVYLRRRHGIELDSWLDLRWFTGYTVGMLVVWSLACA
jgi:Na+-driven multidrug efflux pump